VKPSTLGQTVVAAICLMLCLAACGSDDGSLPAASVTRFQATTPTPAAGEVVTVGWQVRNGTSLIVQQNGSVLYNTNAAADLACGRHDLTGVGGGPLELLVYGAASNKAEQPADSATPQACQ
jgi:hypothetical protein